MLYQFIDWRTFGHNRQMYLVEIESLFRRLREANGGQLPFYLSHWDLIVIFAGEAKIALPENRRVAETTIATVLYPDLEWLRNQYEKLIQYVGERPEGPGLLKDPPYTPPPVIHEPETDATVKRGSVSTPPLAGAVEAVKELAKATPEQFDTIVEGSVSNTDDRQCSALPPATASPTSTLTGSPNSSSTGRKSPPRR